MSVNTAASLGRAARIASSALCQPRAFASSAPSISARRPATRPAAAAVGRARAGSASSSAARLDLRVGPDRQLGGVVIAELVRIDVDANQPSAQLELQRIVEVGLAEFGAHREHDVRLAPPISVPPA